MTVANTGTTILRLSSAPGQAQTWSKTQPQRFPMRVDRIGPNATSAQIATRVNQHLEETEKATAASRDVASTVRTVYVAVPFTYNVPITLPHLLGTPDVTVRSSSARSYASGVPFFIWTVTKDGTGVVLTPIGTFVADVEIGPLP